MVHHAAGYLPVRAQVNNIRRAGCCYAPIHLQLITKSGRAHDTLQTLLMALPMPFTCMGMAHGMEQIIEALKEKQPICSTTHYNT